MSYFLIQKGRDSRRVKVDSFPVSIGRDPINSIVIDDEGVSRFHVKIKKKKFSYIIQDLGSRNGIYINGEKVSNSVLHNNDQVQIGETLLTFVHSANLVQDIDNILTSAISEIDNNPLPMVGFTAKRFTPRRMLERCEKKDSNRRHIYQQHNKLIFINNIDDFTNQLLVAVQQLLPSVMRAAFFSWQNGERLLTPLGFREYSEERESFKINKVHIGQVINRQRTLLFASQQTNIALLPMLLFDKKVIALLHVEFNHQSEQHTADQLDILQALISRVAPNFEMLTLTQELGAWNLSMIKSITKTLEEKDTYTMGHSERVSKYTLAIAEVMGLDSRTKKNLLASALCHDIGKIGIPDSILKKSTLLRNDEYEEMKMHPLLGAEIVSHMPNSRDFISGILYHHERWNGTGYPEGLVGEKIPFFGRVIAVTDSFDAMVSGRSYSGFISKDEAYSRLINDTDLYDTEILEAFAKAYEEGEITDNDGTRIQKLP